MAHTFTLPDLGEGLTEGEIARWLVREGQAVSENDPIVEIQTDKATVEVGSPVAGVVLRIVVREGEIAPVGATLAVIGAEGEHLLRPVAMLPVEPPQPAEPHIAVVGSDPETLRLHRLARELSVDFASVEGTGPAGRVTEGDIRGLAAPAEGRRVPVRGIRRAIVEQVERTHREIPAVTFVEECDFTGVNRGILVATALKAAAASLPDFAELNARIEGDEIVLLDRYDLGVAVDTEAGLVVPVVRGCDRLSGAEIDAEIERLAEGARAGTLQPDELRDSTFTVTSAGRLGGIFVTPLINHPEVAILGLHRIGPRPVARDGEVVVREMGNVSVTFDHRVVDGARAGAFCVDVIRRLERHPESVH
jgi:pyruvate/2-oxoglutarate dehydrogenase complex dihydrolipoamide acyltransferase (E2) component